MTCPSCLGERAAGKLECGVCAAPLAVACSGCGTLSALNAKFCSECGRPLAAVEAPPAALSLVDRRMVTVLFCDVVDSIKLTYGLHPEDARQFLSSYHRWVRTIVEANGGLVVQFRGDGVVAYFGYPRAREDDATRALKTSLALIGSDTHHIAPGKTISVRIGIATGDVVVGDLSLTAGGDLHSIAGDAPNLAARLHSLAAPGQAVIDTATREIAGGLFDYESLGPQVLKGIPGEVEVWRVVAESSAESRFEAVHPQATLTSMVNRKAELVTLCELWRRAEAGQGQAVLLSGEPGIGKSRLTLALREILTEDRAFSVRFYCSPYHRNSSLFPLVSHIERAARLEPGDTPAIKLDKIERLIEPVEPAVNEVAPLFAALLSIPTGGRYPPVQLSAQRQRARTIAAMEAQLGRLAEAMPLLIVFEDLQWADASTLEFLEQQIRRIAGAPILLVMTCRPEFAPRWEQIPAIHRIEIGRLSRQDSEALIEAVIDRSRLAEGVREQILQRSDGVPLFVEEVTKTALETGGVGNNSEPEASAGMWSEAPVPKPLYASLMARLDQLAPWRRVAQTAAAIGRQFSYELMAALFEHDHDFLTEALNRLAKAELIVIRNEPPRATYTFKHALLQDVAYASLLRSERRDIHERIARTLEERFPDSVANQPELLAMHYASASMMEPAVAYWQKAGVRAQQRSAHAEAIEAFKRALALLNLQPAGPPRDRRELDLQFQLGSALTAARGFAAPEVAAAYRRARQLSPLSADDEQRFTVLRGLWIYQLVQADMRTAADLAAEMAMFAATRSNSGYALEARRAAGMTMLWRGEFGAAYEELQAGARLYDPHQHHSHALRYGNDPGIACIVHEAFAAWMIGQPDRALSRCEDAVALAGRLAHPFSLAQSLVYLSFIHQCRHEPELVKKTAGEARVLAVEYGFPFWLAEATIMEGWAESVAGDAASGLARMRAGLGDFLATGARMDRPRWLALQVEAMASCGRIDAGLEAVEEALAAVEATGECFFEARLRQLKGELLLRRGGVDAAGYAQACFGAALDVARRQKARSWELLAATSLARLRADEGGQDAARTLLAPIVATFEANNPCPNLRNARALLAQLS